MPDVWLDTVTPKISIAIHSMLPALEKKGYSTLVTAKKATQTTDMLDALKVPYHEIGDYGETPKEKLVVEQKRTLEFLELFEKVGTPKILWTHGDVSAIRTAFTLGSTLDNTIYKTSAVKAIGGFPKIEVNAGVDTTLAYRLKKAGYSWIVDYNVQSEHLRSGLRQELAHQYWYGTQVHEIYQRVAKETHQTPPISKWGIIYRFIISPFTGLFMAYKTREATVAYIHPLIRFYYLKGYLEAGKLH